MNKCNLVGDLLPQYAEGLLSEDGKKFVENHLAHCSSCAEKVKKLMTPVEVEEAPAPPSEESERSLKGVQKKFRRRGCVIAAVAVCLSAVVAACAVFFPMRLKEVRDILYPYGVNGQPPALSSIWTYPTDSMIKLGEPIETYKKEPPQDGDPFVFDDFFGFPESDVPAVTLFLPKPYRRIDEGAELENTNLFLWVHENSFERVFGVSQDDVSSDAPVAAYCKEHSLTTWARIADYAITYRKSEFSLLFSPNSAAEYTADIFRVRDVVKGAWTRTLSPQVYHPLRGAFEGYAFSHEGARGKWDVFVTTEQFVYHLQIFGLEGENVLFPDGESIAALLATATFA